MYKRKSRIWLPVALRRITVFSLFFNLVLFVVFLTATLQGFAESTIHMIISFASFSSCFALLVSLLNLIFTFFIRKRFFVKFKLFIKSLGAAALLVVIYLLMVWMAALGEYF